MSDVIVERDQPATMRDGCVLRADIYRPDRDGTFPALICRTPYGKYRKTSETTARELAALGYVAIVQDLRGCKTSDGDFVWIMNPEGERQDAEDGYDSVEWAAGLPWVDGRVGTWGVSNPSGCAWRLAGEQPPSLIALHTAGFSEKSTQMNFGILDTGRRFQWAYNLAADTKRRHGATHFPLTGEEANDDWFNILRGKWIWQIPLSSIPDNVFGPLTPQLHRWYREVHEDVWKIDRIHPRVTVPTLSMTGWWDRLHGTVKNFEGMVRASGGNPDGRHRLLIGPWSHNPDFLHGRLGPRDYGPEAETTYGALLARYYDHFIKGLDNGVAEEAPVQLFVLNANTWIRAETYPLPQTRWTDFFLGSSGSANTPDGDGTLRPGEPVDSAPDTYTYDPADPVMSLMAPDSQAVPMDQRPLDSRQDVLVYQTEPLTEPLVVAGPVRCEFFAASSAVDTDFTLKLVEVGADGVAINLSWAIVRARYREGYDREVPLRPGEVTRFEVEMSPIAIRFEKGSRVRLDISSSDFPNFDRNHNTGRSDYWNDPDFVVAEQVLHHDRRYPSRLILPVIPQA